NVTNAAPIGAAPTVPSPPSLHDALPISSGTTNANGVATGTLSSTVTGSKTVSATANGTGITQTASVTVGAGPVSAAQSTVAASRSAEHTAERQSPYKVAWRVLLENLDSG